MKKQLIVAIATISLIIGLSGCATTPVAPSTQTAVTAAAAIGTAYDLSQRPKDLPYFIAAEQELYSIANSTNDITSASLNTVLSDAGQTNAFVDTAITIAIQTANSYIASVSGTNDATIKEASGWIADGIAQSATPQVLSLKAPKK